MWVGGWVDAYVDGWNRGGCVCTWVEEVMPVWVVDGGMPVLVGGWGGGAFVLWSKGGCPCGWVDGGMLVSVGGLGGMPMGLGGRGDACVGG